MGATAEVPQGIRDGGRELGRAVPTEMPPEGLEILATAQAEMFLDVCTPGARRGLDAKRLRKQEWSRKMKRTRGEMQVKGERESERL